MIRRSNGLLAIGASGMGVLAFLTPAPRAQPAGHGAAAPAGASAPRTHTMEELHKSGGVPRGWKFTLVAYAAAGGPGAHAGHTHGAAAGAGHLLVFVSDRTTGEPVPYLPVTVTLRGQGMKPRPVTLVPMAGEQGFHYGVAVTVPDETEKVVVSIGRTTMRVMPSAKGRFAKPVRVEFAWEGS